MKFAFLQWISSSLSRLFSFPPVYFFLRSLLPSFQLQRVGEHNVNDKKKMSAERCAELVAAATAYDLEEAWYEEKFEDREE